MERCHQCGEWVATWEDSWQCEHGWNCEHHGVCRQCEPEEDNRPPADPDWAYRASYGEDW